MGFWGQQKLNKNGEIVIDWLSKYNLTLLNGLVECDGMYTWTVGERRSVIDYCLVNEHLMEKFGSISIDENKEIIDLSDHNLITINFKIRNNINNEIKNICMIKSYMQINESTVTKYLEELRKTEIREIKTLTELEKEMGKAAETTMRREKESKHE